MENNSVLDTLIALPVLALFYVLSLLPEILTVWLCMFLGVIARLLHIRYQVVETNLQIAFPQMSKQERETLIKRIYINFGRLLGEWLALRKRVHTLEKRVRCVGLEEFHKAIQEGNGVIVCSAHFGHWEVLAAVVAAQGKAPLKILRNELSNRHIDKWFTGIHADFGFGEIIRQRSALRIFRYLKKNEIIGMLIDQNGRSGGIWLPFFNRPTSFYRGPGQIASKTGCAVILAFCYPQQDGTWEVQFSRLKGEMTGNIEEDIQHVMGSFATQLQKAITQRPDWYFWFHRRWKTRVPKAIQSQWESR